MKFTMNGPIQRTMYVAFGGISKRFLYNVEQIEGFPLFYRCDFNHQDGTGIPQIFKDNGDGTGKLGHPTSGDIFKEMTAKPSVLQLIKEIINKIDAPVDRGTFGEFHEFINSASNPEESYDWGCKDGEADLAEKIRRILQ